MLNWCFFPRSTDLRGQLWVSDSPILLCDWTRRTWFVFRVGFGRADLVFGQRLCSYRTIPRTDVRGQLHAVDHTMRFGCKDCCKPPAPPIECELGHVGQYVRGYWTLGDMDRFSTMCLNDGPLRFDFLYAPMMSRLSPPDGRPGRYAGSSCFGDDAGDYFVFNRAESRFVQPRSFRCNPFTVVPGPEGGEEEPASDWGCSGQDWVYALSSSTGSGLAPGGHAREGVRWPEWQWELKADAPKMTFWEFIEECVGFEPSKVTLLMNCQWFFEVDIHTGHINLFAALWGETEPKVDVTTDWNVALKINIFDRDEPAARAMLAGDLGGRVLWSHSVSQTIPGDAQRGGFAGTPQFQALRNAGNVTVEVDVSMELQTATMDSQVLWIGPRIEPPFGDKLVHMSTAIVPPRTEPIPYPVGYWRKGTMLALFPVQSPPPGGAMLDRFRVYPLP